MWVVIIVQTIGCRIETRADEASAREAFHAAQGDDDICAVYAFNAKSELTLIWRL